MTEAHSEGMTRIIGELMEELGVFVFLQLWACPVQIYGNIDGYFLDFYSRGSHWTLNIGPDLELSERYGDTPHAAGWIEPDDVKRILTEHITAYRSTRPTAPESEAE